MRKRMITICMVICMTLMVCGSVNAQNVQTAVLGERPVQSGAGAYDRGKQETGDDLIVLLDFGGRSGTYKVTVRPFSMDAVRVPVLLLKKEAGRLCRDIYSYGQLFDPFLTAMPLNRKIKQTIYECIKPDERNVREYEIQFCTQ